MANPWGKINLGDLWDRAGSVSMSRTSSELAPLQLGPAQQYEAKPTQFVQPNSVQLPSWMNTNADASMQELLKSYKKIPKAFDPTAQVDARNDAIQYQTTAGGQAANNAATEYATRAMQSGGSALGAGVVKAQSMMPVFAANAGLKSEAADIAAKSHQQAASLAAQVASTIAGLRSNHLQSLAQFTSQQQSMAMQNNQFNARMGLDVFNANVNAKNQRDDLALRRDALSLQESDQARLAATTMLQQPGPTGGWETDNLGQVVGDTTDYDKYVQWGEMRDAAQGALIGMYR